MRVRQAEQQSPSATPPAYCKSHSVVCSTDPGARALSCKGVHLPTYYPADLEAGLTARARIKMRMGTVKNSTSFPCEEEEDFFKGSVWVASELRDGADTQ